MLKDSKALLHFFVFLFLLLFLGMNGRQDCFKTDTHIYSCHEMPPIFETHVLASRRSNFKLDLAWIFLCHTERSLDLATIPFNT